MISLLINPESEKIYKHMLLCSEITSGHPSNIFCLNEFNSIQTIFTWNENETKIRMDHFRLCRCTFGLNI